MKRLLLPALLALAIPSQPARAAVDLSEHDGVYRGTYQLEINNAPSTMGFLTALVRTNPSGRRLMIELFGAVTPANGSTTPYPTYNLLQLKSNRQVFTNNILLGNIEDFHSATSRFSGKSQRFTYTLTTAIPAITMTYILKFTKKRIVIRGTGTATGLGTVPVKILFQGKRK